MLTCMAKALRATEIGPFSASQAAMSKGKKIKFSHLLQTDSLALTFPHPVDTDNDKELQLSHCVIH